MKKKLSVLALTAAMALTLAACGNPNPPAESGNSDADGRRYTVGICQLAPHDALDAATQGFKDALTEALGDAVRFSEGNAGGEANNCATIVDGFLAEGVDLILANATPALTAAASATSDIPILGTAVTNYGVALNLDTTEDSVLGGNISGTSDLAPLTVGGNVSGTSDLAPLDQQADLLHELFPDAGTVGLLYCSAEPNSVFQVETIQGYLEVLGYTCARYAFTDVNDVASVAQTACDGSDVLYIPTDNTAANNTETIANVVLPNATPVVTGESGLCSGCGVATLSIDYYELGQITGQMAARILTGQESVSEMAIAYDTTLTKLCNADNCNALGIPLPDDFEPLV